MFTVPTTAVDGGANTYAVLRTLPQVFAFPKGLCLELWHNHHSAARRPSRRVSAASQGACGGRGDARSAAPLTTIFTIKETVIYDGLPTSRIKLRLRRRLERQSVRILAGRCVSRFARPPPARPRATWRWRSRTRSTPALPLANALRMAAASRGSGPARCSPSSGCPWRRLRRRNGQREILAHHIIMRHVVGQHRGLRAGPAS